MFQRNFPRGNSRAAKLGQQTPPSPTVWEPILGEIYQAYWAGDHYRYPATVLPWGVLGEVYRLVGGPCYAFPKHIVFDSTPGLKKYPICNHPSHCTHTVTQYVQTWGFNGYLIENVHPVLAFVRQVQNVVF